MRNYGYLTVISSSMCVCMSVGVCVRMGWRLKAVTVNHNIQLEMKSKMEVHNSFDFL